MKNFTTIVLFLISSICSAQSLSPSTRLEIDHLFADLEKSNCEFNRNGRWYSAQQASAHLRKKYDYLSKRDLVTTTESFIDLAATKSSMSGKLYVVRCDNRQPLPSKTWSFARLNKIRDLPLR